MFFCNSRKLVRIFLLWLLPFIITACVHQGTTNYNEFYRPAKKELALYEEAGKWWGGRHQSLKFRAEQIDEPLVGALIDIDDLDFFSVHAELKDAFKKGYRLGYQERTADLVLGPHLTRAAQLIGGNTAGRFVKVVEVFEEDWAQTLNKAVHVFITLISEGSQADRERFIQEFANVYDKKYQKTQLALREGGVVTHQSEGGTTLYLDARKTLTVLRIPATQTLKTEIYHQTFKVMGDEWGRRFSHNLIKRDELIDLLRRSKTAFDEVEPNLSSNLRIVRDAFIASYGTDAKNVFSSLAKEAGYTFEALVDPDVRSDKDVRRKNKQ